MYNFLFFIHFFSCNESDKHLIKTTEEKNFNHIKDDKNSDCVQTAESNCFGSHIIWLVIIDLPTYLEKKNLLD